MQGDGLKRKAGIVPGMALSEKSGAEYLTFPAISRTGVVSHLMTMRAGGVSEGDLWSLNLGFSRGDRPENVRENFRRAAALLGCLPEDMVCSDQTHTTNIRRVTNADRGKGVVRPKDYRDVDGLITDEPGIALATFYADCVPLLFVDPLKRAVGLSHSGWRGTARGMGAETVHAMQEAFGSRPEDLLVGIGPSICRDCYEVSEDVADAFRILFSGKDFRKVPIRLSRVLFEKGNGKYLLDLWKANEAVCLSAGVLPEHISMTDICTCCNPGRLFSHRASGGKRGNMGMFVMLLEEN
ncbi:MAG TPA: peptidoglycan editing factor PgeF [Candidatus Eisenbergiella merdipullorum]|uniref:Purine nucleoside phosphorylase n=1 Tax=Candidatus Eisenbergiella merdipullorum TaxID=2838553 RepID=A0A9D2I8Y2_9FIRM|nr:peptidoglycan editing factor PgeF [Candidatus Eisenbergiella merdipullorum]